MNIWHDADPGRIAPSSFDAVIEISKGGKNKYELDKTTGMLRLDRVLYTSTHYPANYGFIPRTLVDDGDPLDVLVLCQETIAPLTLVKVRPIGVMLMIDEEAKDEKIIAVPEGDPTFSCYQDVSELPDHTSQEISHFFQVYKELENKKTFVKEVLGRVYAEKIVGYCIEEYDKQYGNKEK